MLALACGPETAQLARTVTPSPDCPTVLARLVVPRAAPCGGTCGTDRWPVKTLTDRDVASIDWMPRRTTIREVGSFPRPQTRPDDRRAGSAERQLYCIDAMVLEARPQDDGDLHLKLAQVDDPAATMIVEIPDVRCSVVCSAPFAPAFDRARTMTELALKNWKSDTLRIRVVGVGFFDRNHGQIGAAPNFFELHPVLAVTFP